MGRVWEVGVGGWEVAGGKSEDRRRSLEIESIDRCRSNRFSHGMLIDIRLYTLSRSPQP